MNDLTSGAVDAEALTAKPREQAELGYHIESRLSDASSARLLHLSGALTYE